jgi:hypothetical protein
MPLNPPGLYRIKLIGELHGQATETAFHFATNASGNVNNSYSTELTDLMANFITNIVPKYQLFCSQEWAGKTVVGITLIPKASVFIETRLANGTGTQPDNSLPSFCAGLLSLRTGAGGRSRIGRIYIPGVSEGLSSSSRLEGNYLSLLSGIGAALLQQYGPSGGFPYVRYGVYSRKLGVTRTAQPPYTLNYSAVGFQIINSIIARPEVATQRRRKLARGI